MTPEQEQAAISYIGAFVMRVRELAPTMRVEIRFHDFDHIFCRVLHADGTCVDHRADLPVLRDCEDYAEHIAEYEAEVICRNYALRAESSRGT